MDLIFVLLEEHHLHQVDHLVMTTMMRVPLDETIYLEIYSERTVKEEEGVYSIYLAVVEEILHVTHQDHLVVMTHLVIPVDRLHRLFNLEVGNHLPSRRKFDMSNQLKVLLSLPTVSPASKIDVLYLHLMSSLPNKRKTLRPSRM